MALITTPGAVNANSYETLVEAAAYHALRPFSDVWIDAEDTEREPVLAHGTRLLDTLNWNGVAAAESQALAFPRSGLVYPSGYAVPANVIPRQIKDALSELARLLLVSDRMAESEVGAQGITSVKAGSVALTFKEGIEVRAIPDAVLSMIPKSWYLTVEEALEADSGFAEIEVI